MGIHLKGLFPNKKEWQTYKERRGFESVAPLIIFFFVVCSIWMAFIWGVLNSESDGYYARGYKALAPYLAFAIPIACPFFLLRDVKKVNEENSED